MRWIIFNQIYPWICRWKWKFFLWHSCAVVMFAFCALPSWSLLHIRHLCVNICGALASIFLLNDVLHYEEQTSEDLKSQGELWWALTSVFGDSPFYFKQSLIIYCHTIQNLTCNMIFTIAAHDFLLYEPFCFVVWTFGTQNITSWTWLKYLLMHTGFHKDFVLMNQHSSLTVNKK